MSLNALVSLATLCIWTQASAFDSSGIDGQFVNVAVSGDLIDDTVRFSEMTYAGESFQVYDYTVVGRGADGWTTMLIVTDEATHSYWMGNYRYLSATNESRFVITAQLVSWEKQHPLLK